MLDCYLDLLLVCYYTVYVRVCMCTGLYAVDCVCVSLLLHVIYRYSRTEQINRHKQLIYHQLPSPVKIIMDKQLHIG